MRLKAELVWFRHYLDLSSYEQQLSLHRRVNVLTSEIERLNRDKVNADFQIDKLCLNPIILYHELSVYNGNVCSCQIIFYRCRLILMYFNKIDRLIMLY